MSQNALRISNLYFLFFGLNLHGSFFYSLRIAVLETRFSYVPWPYKNFVESLLDLYESIYSISLISLRYLINDGTTLTFVYWNDKTVLKKYRREKIWSECPVNISCNLIISKDTWISRYSQYKRTLSSLTQKHLAFAWIARIFSLNCMGLVHDLTWFFPSGIC